MDPISLSVISGLFAGGYVLNKNGKNPRENSNISDEYSDDELDSYDNSMNNYQESTIQRGDPSDNQLYIDKVTQDVNNNLEQNYYDSYMSSERSLPYYNDRGGNSSYDVTRPETQPFYGTNVTQSVDYNRGQERLNKFTGSPPEYIPKREQTPFFDPVQDMGRANPAVPSYLREEYHVGDNKKFVKPIESVRVGPGLNVGSDVVATGGFHPTTRFVPQITDEHNINQLESRIIPGKGENMNRGVQSEVDKNQPYRFYVRSDESFLPTSSDASGPSVRPMIQQNTNDTRGVGSVEHELYMGTVSDLQGGSRQYVSDGYNTPNQTNRDRPCENPNYMGGAVGHQSHETRQGYRQTHMSDREEMALKQQHKPGNVVAGYQTQARNDVYLAPTNREQIGQNKQGENIMNVSQPGFGMTPNVNSYRTDPTNREQTMKEVSGGASVGNMGHSTQLSSMNAPVTGRESIHEERFGGVGSSNYQAGMSYESLLKTEGYSLRSATDENRMSNPGRSNIMADPDKRVQNLEQKMEINAVREGNINKVNNAYKPLEGTQEPEIHPNKVENINSRFDTSVLGQLETNPFNRDINQ